MTDTVTWQGRSYTAEVSEQDRQQFSRECVSHGSKRCAIDVPHSSYVHLVIGLAEQAGNVRVSA